MGVCRSVLWPGVRERLLDVQVAVLGEKGRTSFPC